MSVWKPLWWRALHCGRPKADYVRRYKRKHKKLGLCLWCVREAEVGFTLCKEHRAWNIRYQAQRRQERAA